jgi:hypothetical protein
MSQKVNEWKSNQISFSLNIDSLKRETPDFLIGLGGKFDTFIASISQTYPTDTMTSVQCNKIIIYDRACKKATT